MAIILKVAERIIYIYQLLKIIIDKFRRSFYVKNMRGVRQAPQFRQYRLTRTQRQQADFLPQPAYYKDKSERDIQANQGMHEMPQGHGKDLTAFLLTR
jgi:hypothetical protein